MAHDQEAIQQQVAWQALRPTVKNPPGALVKAIRERWAPPPAWLERQQRDAAAARQAAEAAARTAEVAAERRHREALPPEERVQGHLEFWLMGQRRRGREPAATEIAAKQAELITQLTAPPRPLARAA